MSLFKNFKFSDEYEDFIGYLEYHKNSNYILKNFEIGRFYLAIIEKQCISIWISS